MKRQLNFWSAPHGASEKDLINSSLSIEDNQFTIRFGRPGSVTPITQMVFFIDEEKSFDLRRAFELSGCQVFQDEMDERIYFGNIARQRESVKHIENRAVYICWATVIYIMCMIICFTVLKLPIILTSCISLFVSILAGFLVRKKVMKNE